MDDAGQKIPQTPDSLKGPFANGERLNAADHPNDRAPETPDSLKGPFANGERLNAADHGDNKNIRTPDPLRSIFERNEVPAADARPADDDHAWDAQMRDKVTAALRGVSGAVDTAAPDGPSAAPNMAPSPRGRY